MDGQTISFGPYRLFTAQRLLLDGDKPVRLGSRAFDILAALVERAGQVVGKEQLIARAWPRTFVEESNLKIQVSALRRAIGDGQNGRRYVVTVPGRGYNFVAPVRVEKPPQIPVPQTIAPAGAHNLPLALTRVIDREETVEAIVSRLSRQRLVTIVGPGGIGKTTVALAVAEQMIAGYEDGVWLVDLAPLSGPRLVPSAIATVLGLEIRTENPIPGLIAALRDRRMLLLLDNCEHVIDAVAGFVSAILGGASGIDILATSREPIGVAGEREYRLGPLGSPQPSPALTAAETASFPAVQLFVERVTATVEDFVLTDANAPAVVDICRRLDGLPLALEFAAPRVEVLGVEGLAAHLDDSFPLLKGRRRATLARHRTMRTVLDWSYGLLSADEQSFLRALAVFPGGFAVEAAASIAMDGVQARISAIDRLADLVAKSLIVVDVTGAEPRFRLLNTTRAYVVEKLEECGDRQQIARRHAAYYRDLFSRAETDAAVRPTSAWLDDYAPELDNLRAALDWAFSPGGDDSVGVALTAAAVPLWMRLSLLQECCARAKQALGALATGVTPNQRERMRLHAALGASTSNHTEAGAPFAQALEIAESLRDLEYQLRALRGLYFYHTGSGRYLAALPFAQRFHDLAMSGSDPADRLFGERMMGVAKHFIGDQNGARRHVEHVLSHHAATDPGRDVIGFRDVIRFGNDLYVSSRVFLARVLWLQGLPDQAVRMAGISLAEARATGHANTVCYVLALAACPIAFWVGDLAAAMDYAGELLDLTTTHGLQLNHAFGSRFRRILALKAGQPDRKPYTDLTEIPLFSTGLSELAEALAHAGRIAEAGAVLEAGIEHSEAGWLTPELLRIKGELLLLQGAPTAAGTAVDLFQQVLNETHRQGALAWELRAATSLARLLNNQGRPADAIACLQPVYDRFTEGFGTADLMAARRLLDELGDAHHD